MNGSWKMAKESATRQVIVTHRPGIHARPSLAIVNTVRRFQSEVTIRNGHHAGDAREILQVMSLGVPCGAEVTLSAQGPDAEEAVDALVNLFADNFGMDGD
jgi:phosphotransferase system HPr (HPr) family protein